MKNIKTYINENTYSEWCSVRCKQEYQSKHQTFRINDEYDASKINTNWWLIDTVGVNNDDFLKYFEIIKK